MPATKTDENTQSPQLATILPPREIKGSSSAPEYGISVSKYEPDKNKATSPKVSAPQRPNSPKLSKQSSIKSTSVQKRSFHTRTTQRTTLLDPNSIRISRIIAAPKEEKEWQEPEKKPMTGTSFREMNDYRRKLKQRLHIPTQRELKRSHVPFYVSLPSELEEDGFQDAANFIRYLIDFDKQRRVTAEEDSLVQYEPKLIDNESHLTRLGIGLKEANKARIKEDISTESSCTLQLAVFFTKESKEWWWIAQQLFEKCINILKDFHTDGGEKEANARYCYGHFLLTEGSLGFSACTQECILQELRENIVQEITIIPAAELQRVSENIYMIYAACLRTEAHEPDKAKENLQIAYSLSCGKRWRVSEGPQLTSHFIYTNACNLLYEALVQTAIQIRQEDPKAAVRLCNLALRRAKEGGSEEGEARVMLELGICTMIEDIHAALEVFFKLLSMKLGPSCLTYICNAHLQVALCYKHLGDFEQALQHLEIFKNIAEENELKEQLAAANRYLGEFHLNMDNGSLARAHLETSFNMYLELGITEEIEQSRLLASIGAGHEVLPDYIQLIHQCGDPRNTDAFTKLLNWKISNVPFWKTNELPVDERDSDDKDSERPSDQQSMYINESMES